MAVFLLLLWAVLLLVEAPIETGGSDDPATLCDPRGRRRVDQLGYCQARRYKNEVWPEVRVFFTPPEIVLYINGFDCSQTLVGPPVDV